jgi:hypothetical protein
VPIGIRVIGEGNPIAVFEADESGHRIWTGAVHANDAVVVDGHERKGRINPRIDDCDLQSIGGIDRLPVIDGGAAKRVDRETEPSGANGVHVDHVAQIVDIGKDEIFLVSRIGVDRNPEGNPLHAGIAVSQKLIGPVFDPLGRVGVGRPPIGWVVLEPAVRRWVVRGGNDNAIGQSIVAGAVVNEDGTRDDRRRREPLVSLDYGLYVICRENAQAQVSAVRCAWANDMNLGRSASALPSRRQVYDLGTGAWVAKSAFAAPT